MSLLLDTRKLSTGYFHYSENLGRHESTLLTSYSKIMVLSQHDCSQVRSLLAKFTSWDFLHTVQCRSAKVYIMALYTTGKLNITCLLQRDASKAYGQLTMKGKPVQTREWNFRPWKGLLCQSHSSYLLCSLSN
jgi:hypothetical protein